ncbi:unnamed protein product [Mytilus coruscus]|uniref:Uncharacterized protein n=1 Tax=Mytilus coruscus TaxID=42192 RepID=A0A6J8AUL6_MYTCO|nr:unnamed protein product [Mytilus coruscus]
MRDLVKKSSRNLKDSPFGISQQLPLEIQKRRKEKLPLLKELRSRDIKAYFVKDKIFVGGKDAHKVFGRSLLMRKDVIKVRPNNEWFDNNCAIAREDFHVARNFFLHHPSDVNRKAYVISRNNYNKMKRKAQFKYKRRKGIELCDLASTEPRKFWSSIKRKVNNECKIDNETMMKHFESILEDSSQDLCEEVRNLIDNTVFDDINVTQLDSEITEDEVVGSIKKN